MTETFTPAETISNLVAAKDELNKELKEAKRKANELDINYQFSENKRIQDYQNYKTMLDSIRYPDMELKIEVDKEFQSIIPAMTTEEYQGLEAMIIKEGCRDPLVLWKTGDGRNILIGGHNRYKICKKHEIAYSVVQKHFTSRADALDWIIDDQLGRRNLTPEQKAYLFGKKYEQEKKNSSENLKQGGISPIAHSELSGETAEKIAKQHKVSRETVKRAGKFASAVDAITENVDSGFRSKVLNREIKASQADVVNLAKLPVEKQKEIAEEIKPGSNLSEFLKKQEANEEFVFGPVDKELAEIEQKCNGLKGLVEDLTKTIANYEKNNTEFMAAFDAMCELREALSTAIKTYGMREQSYLDFDAA